MAGTSGVEIGVEKNTRKDGRPFVKTQGKLQAAAGTSFPGA
jgi:hypothetical protein